MHRRHLRVRVALRELGGAQSIQGSCAAQFHYYSLMTELWDRNFSQSEIQAAFQEAIKDMPRYAAGNERRSSISGESVTTDWRAPRKL
jgi:hypothetical protein